MEFTKQNIKELLDNGANLILGDSYSEEKLQYIAGQAREKERNITIVAKKLHLEALKRIA